MILVPWWWPLTNVICSSGLVITVENEKPRLNFHLLPLAAKQTNWMVIHYGDGLYSPPSIEHRIQVQEILLIKLKTLSIR